MSTVSRRGMLGALGAVAAGAAAARVARDLRADEAAARSLGLDCVVTPAQTEGPYFTDARLNRSDVRAEPTGGEPRAGVPLRLRIAVHRVTGASCAPLAGAMVDLWQCDAAGEYSDVRDFQGQFDTRGRRFLRGYQLTGADGVAAFLTIYPGWYTGRAVHVHFKVRRFEGGGERRAEEFTSQLYFDEAVTDAVHARPPYNAKGRRDTPNDRDRIYLQRGSGSQLMVRLAPDGDGYRGDFSVGLRSG